MRLAMSRRHDRLDLDREVIGQIEAALNSTLGATVGAWARNSFPNIADRDRLVALVRALAQPRVDWVADAYPRNSPIF